MLGQLNLHCLASALAPLPGLESRWALIGALEAWMKRMCQDEVGRCGFIDVLEEAVLRRRPVAVELRDGASFTDQVVDVVMERGDDFAVFHAHSRVPVGDILAVTRAEPNAAP